MQRNEWLKAAKVGDACLVLARYYNPREDWVQTKIEKLDKRYVWAGGFKFHRNTGYVVGADTQHLHRARRITEPLDSYLHRPEHSEKLRRVRDVIDYGTASSHVSIKQLNAILAILEGKENDGTK